MLAHRLPEQEELVQGVEFHHRIGDNDQRRRRKVEYVPQPGDPLHRLGIEQFGRSPVEEEEERHCEVGGGEQGQGGDGKDAGNFPAVVGQNSGENCKLDGEEGGAAQQDAVVGQETGWQFKRL